MIKQKEDHQLDVLRVFPYVVKIAMHLLATSPLASQLPDFAVLIDC